MDEPASASHHKGRAAALWQQAKAVLFPEHDVISLGDLFQQEAGQIDPAAAAPVAPADDQARRGRWFSVAHGVGGEPWVSSVSRDRLGLALSGGGIRSATFNLGLLQALAALGVLARVDYLSTVSGGGYIGGFWTRWLARQALAGRETGRAHFPLDHDRRDGERAEVRHLREFSRFLLPRLGLFRTDFWTVVMTVLGGIMPSLAAALAMIVLAWGTWMGIVWTLEGPGPAGYRALGALLIVFFAVSEALWLKQNDRLFASRLAAIVSASRLAGGTAPAEQPPRGIGAEYLGYLSGSAVVVVCATLGWALRGMWLQGATQEAARAWQPDLAAALVLAGCGAVMLTLRTVIARFVRGLRDTGVSFVGGFERSLSRVLGATAAAFALAGLWWLGGQIQDAARGATTAVGTAGLAAVFAWARKWLTQPAADTRGSRWFQVVVGWLKRATPRVLAVVVWLLLVVLVGAGVRAIVGDELVWPAYGYLIGGCGGVLLATMWWFDPARVGLHEFYRSRISRCYLGASNTPEVRGERNRVAANRFVQEQPDDDITLGELRQAAVRPLHLVCTAANDLSGDHLATLYRGARSAVLSANGISVGNETARVDYLRLSAALTASAAAFNSQMGRVSIDLGPAVAFLMSALNLRLGLWVPHPQNRRRTEYAMPGRFFMLEMLGLSRTDRRHLHLSDGGHFDNLGLYELIRRHCRYIIVSDCGADALLTFDDLANVLRRVREDFGVEIELDVRPLRPDAEGRTTQHAVVGTIHYDGFNGADKGTLLYVKPTLTGEEPPDVLQYRLKNDRFPHESTSDQFYDEAQWESYRRLGDHSVRTTLVFAESLAHERADFADRLFTGIRERLHPSAEGHRDVFIEMSDRCDALEADVFSNGPRFLRRELFPEAAELRGEEPAAGGPAPDLDEEIQALGYMMRVMQVMEDVWLAADLDRYWSHPLNEGWMNYFQRWASMPTFRRWWPILRPIYNNGFREFARERFGVGVRDAQARPASDPDHAIVGLRLEREEDRDKFTRGHAWRQFVQRSAPPDLEPLSIFVYRMAFADGSVESAAPTLDVGFVLVRERDTDAGWTGTIDTGHFYVPPALIGAGIIGRQLDALIEHYRERVRALGRSARLDVVFEDSTRRPPGRAAREDRIRQIEFFKSRGFQQSGSVRSTLADVTLTLGLAARGAHEQPAS